MLELKNIKKSYKVADFTQTALNGISLKFRKNEFVAVLGQSGSDLKILIGMHTAIIVLVLYFKVTI